MKEKSLFKISIILSDFEKIIFRNLLVLNLLIFLFSFLPFLCAKDLRSNQLNLYQIFSHFRLVWQSLSWHTSLGAILLVVLLSLPFIFFVGAGMLMLNKKNHSRSTILNSMLESSEWSLTGFAVFFLSINLTAHFLVVVYMSVWAILIICFEGIRAGNNLVPAAGFFLAYISLVYFFYKIITEILRKFNRKVILDTSFEFLMDFGKEEVKESLENEELRGLLETVFFIMNNRVILKEGLYDVDKLMFKDLISTNLFADAFPKLVLYLRILFPAARNHERPPVHLIDPDSQQKLYGSFAESIPLGGKRSRNLMISKPSVMHAKAELFTTSKWLYFSKKEFNYYELPSHLNLIVDSAKVKYLENGSVDWDAFYVIESAGDKMVVEELSAKIHIETKPNIIKRYAAWAAGLTILFYVFWYWSEFPYFIGLFQNMNADENEKVLLGILAAYLVGIALSSKIASMVFNRMPVSKVKVFIIAAISSFLITFVNARIKAKYGYFISDQPSGFVMVKKSANVRYHPSKDSAVMYEASPEEEVKIRSISNDGEWYHIYFGENWIRNGFIHKSLVKVDSTLSKTNAAI